MKIIHFCVLISLIVSGCSQVAEESNSIEAEKIVNDVSHEAKAVVTEVTLSDLPAQTVVPKEDTLSSKKIVKSGNMSIETKNIEKSKTSLDRILSKNNGYYEQEISSSNDYNTSYQLSVRIPVQQFDTFLQEIETGEDKITHKSIRADDVSLQYHDLESRLKSKRAYLERYQNMVPSAKTVKELLEIEEQIRQLQEDIDSQEVTFRALKDQVSYSSLEITLSQYSLSKPYSESFLSKITKALGFGWDIIQWAVLGLIGLWPVIIVVSIIIVLWRRRKRNQKGKSM